MHGRETLSDFGLRVGSNALPLTRLCVVSFVLALASVLHAQDEDQDPVFESDLQTQSNDESVETVIRTSEDGVTVFPQSESPATIFDRDDFQLGFLIERVRELQEENSRMLGRIEKLEHEVQLLRHENRDRYVELDERILELSGHAPVASGAVSTAPDDSEAGMYRNAFSMIEDGNYEEAVGTLETMITNYPNGAHLPDAFYWLGQTYAQMDPPKLEEARQNLVQLYRLFPDHAKTPEGMYKLGTILDEMGDKPKALEYLDRVVNDYPSTTAARLAEEYASTIRNE